MISNNRESNEEQKNGTEEISQISEDVYGQGISFPLINQASEIFG